MKWLIVVVISWCIGFISYPLIWPSDVIDTTKTPEELTQTPQTNTLNSLSADKLALHSVNYPSQNSLDRDAFKASLNSDETPYMSIFRIMQLAEQDPLEALLVAQETQHEDLYGLILEIAGKMQFSNVISWLEHQKSTELYESLLDSYLRGLATVNPQQALNEIDLLAVEPMKSSIMMSIVDSWASSDAIGAFEKNIQEAVDWLDGIAVEQRASGVFIISRKMAETDPEAALIFLNNQKQSYNLNQDYFNSALAEIASVEPNMMLARLDNYEARVQRDIIINASYALVEYSENDFLQLINPLSDNNKDIALNQRSAQLNQTDPQQAFNVAELINDPATRLESIINTITVWSGFDKRSALAAIDNSSQLTASQKGEISTQIQLQLTSSNIIYP
mgnify:CR=1 FL=1